MKVIINILYHIGSYEKYIGFTLRISEWVRGVARDSNARRRSHLVWAPPHKNFLLKILVPAFDSSLTGQTKTPILRWAFLFG